jgi:hypothetical protein
VAWLQKSRASNKRDIGWWRIIATIQLLATVGGELLRGSGADVSIEAITFGEIAEWNHRAKRILVETISVGVFTDDDLDLVLIEHDRVGVLTQGLVSYLIQRRFEAGGSTVIYYEKIQT